MRIAIAVLVVLHFFATIWHGQSHASLGIALAPGEDAFVFIVIVLAPIVAALLVWTRYQYFGVWLFLLCMLASFLFGAYHHYVAVSPDNVRHLPQAGAAARSAFTSSAAVLALLELCSALYGAFCIHRIRAAQSSAHD